MSRLKLTLATAEYDHIADISNGRVVAEGIDLAPLVLQIEEMFFRFINFREFDVSEMSMGKYVSLASQDDKRFTAIPVFPSRIFRHSSIYVRRDGRVQAPADLVGKRVGLPEWAQTAAIYSRGFLAHQYGLDLTAINWVQSGVNQAGRAEKVALQLPNGIRLERVTDRSLDEMLLAGDLDAILSAHPPESFEHGHPNIKRMFEDYMAVETQYYKDTGIFPIMHVIAMKREIAEEYPWVPMNLFKAFEEAKARSVARMLEVTAPRVPIPWCYEHTARAQALFGPDHWPYGIAPNHRTLSAFLQYAHEQGVCHRLLTPEELFPAQMRKSFKV
jgi:4,5-dihydroxyphthalate decarboxylase